MIQITPQMRIWLAVEPVDFRKGIDGLAQLCRQTASKSTRWRARSCVFANRRRKALSVLIYDGQGFWLCQKRLSKGALAGGPPKREPADLGLGRASTPIAAVEWQSLQRTQAVPMWRRD